MPAAVIRLEQLAVEPERYPLAPAKLLAGNPRQTVWMHHQDPTRKFFVGEWHSEVGRWQVAYTEHEFCQMLEGTSVVTDETGHAETFHAGDCFVMPRGFVGTWEVVVPTRKRFVIYEPDGAPT